MSSFKSYWSSIKYHAVTRPSIHLAEKTIKAVGGKLLHKARAYAHSKGYGRKPGLRAAVMQKTRGHASTSKTLFSKGTVAGQKRRAIAAANAKASRAAKYRTTPTATPARPAPAARPTPKAAPVRRSTVKAPVTKGAPSATRTPNRSVGGAIATSKTHGQLRRKLAGLAVRGLTRHAGITRKEAANHIKSLRKKLPGATRGLVKTAKAAKMRTAAEQLAARK